MSDLPSNPTTRIERLLAQIAGQMNGIPQKPVARIEVYLAKIAGEDVDIPVPLSRIEQYLAYIAEHSGGGSGGEMITQALNVTENGRYVAPPGKAYTPVVVNVQLEPYGGEYTVIPDTVGKTLETKGYFMEGDVNVLPIPYAETSNLSGGYTATIGG